MQMQTGLTQTLLWFVCSVVEMCGSLSALRADGFRPLEQDIFGDPGLLFWVHPAAKNGRILGTIFRAQRVQKRTHFEDQIPAAEQGPRLSVSICFMKGGRNMAPVLGPQYGP